MLKFIRRFGKIIPIMAKKASLIPKAEINYKSSLTKLNSAIKGFKSLPNTHSAQSLRFKALNDISRAEIETMTKLKVMKRVQGL